MVLLDLFPAGAIQFKSVVEQGLWYGRSAHFIEGGVFESLTWLRGIGASVFYFGGVLPLAWFVISRFGSIKAWNEAASVVTEPQPEPEPEAAIEEMAV